MEVITMNAYRTGCNYQVITRSTLDGIHVDHFATEIDAQEFAAMASKAGFTCTICLVLGVTNGMEVAA
jgi:hypothetical protein